MGFFTDLLIAEQNKNIILSEIKESNNRLQKLEVVAEAAKKLIDEFICPMDEDGSLLYAQLDAALKALDQE